MRAPRLTNTLDHMSQIVEFEGAVWQWEARQSDSWYFVTLPSEFAVEIADRSSGQRGFGSVKVTATIGSTAWATSIFPDKASGSYVLPLKKAVRAAEGVDADDVVRVRIELLP